MRIIKTFRLELWLVLLLVLSACTENSNELTELDPLYTNLESNRLNLKDGYLVNSVTGDSISFFYENSGDTAVTGQPKALKLNVIDSVVLPLFLHDGTISEGELIKVNAHPNRFEFDIKDEFKLLSFDSLKKIEINDHNSTDTAKYLLNGLKDSIKTGVLTAIKGKTKPFVYSRQISVDPTIFKDLAMTDIQYLDMNQGLISSSIQSSCIDSKGNLWLGSYGQGVCCFNGQSYTFFSKEEGLTSNWVWSILEDNNGDIWFGTDNGACKYDGNNFTQFTEKEGLTHKSIWTIYQDSEENIWFGTYGGGVSRYYQDSIIHFTVNEGLSNNTVTSILESDNGLIWIGTFGGGANIYDGVSFTHLLEKDGLISNGVYDMVEDGNGNIWFGTINAGACYYNGEGIGYLTMKDGLASNIIMSMTIDKNGSLWFGTWNEGVSSYDGKFLQNFSKKQGLSDNAVVSMITDNSNNLWIGTFSGGLNRFAQHSFSSFNTNQGLSDNSVRSVIEDDLGNLWFITNDGGLNKYDGTSFVIYSEKDGLASNRLLSGYKDSKGNLWFGTYGSGVSCFNGSSFSNISLGEGTSRNTVRDILEDSQGVYWFATDNGIVRYDGNDLEHFGKNEGLLFHMITAIEEDSNGNLWFGSYGGGITQFDGQYFVNYTEREGLSSNNVWSIFADSEGRVWFGTEQGACFLEDESFSYIGKKEGLSSDIVRTFLEDENGTIWIGTSNGLSQVEFANDSIPIQNINKRSVFVRSFDRNDGLQCFDFNSNSGLIDKNNRIWLGSKTGVLNVDLSNFEISSQAPIVSLNEVLINEQFIDFRNLSDSAKSEIQFSEVEKFKNYPLNLRLPHNKNHLTFQFSAIDWFASHKIMYSFRLKGLNEQWSVPSSSGIADFRNLPHGDFTLEIKSYGESLEWSDTLKYKFSILPPWWHTWWARVMYVLLAFLTVFVLVKWRTMKLKQRQIELEEEVRIATTEIIAQKDEIENQKEQVEEAHKEITDSINYAERIQRSFLATSELLNTNLEDYFVFFQPKEAVSGDFYWAGELANGNFAVVNADSTGHGVPGAIMSILNISSIESAVKDQLTHPADIFNEARKIIIERLKKDGSAEGGKDGMDASLISLNKDKTKMSYVAAQNPIWIIRSGELIEIKPEKMPVGKHDNDHVSFSGGEFDLEKGDLIYTLTDGFQDQFGGEKGKKFKVKPLKNLILKNAHLPMQEQKNIYINALNDWKGELEQVDDICLIGIKV